MQITLQDFPTLVRNMSASTQGACAALTDFTVGSATRAILEASASVALWLQYLILQVMTMCRLATSAGPDVDSWVGDFGLVRLPGVAATGSATLTSLSPGSQSGVVPPGAQLRTSDGSQSFTIVADTARPSWSQQTGAYVRPAGTASIDVAVQAVAVGRSGNVQAGAINLLGQSMPGIDTVTNLQALSNGVDAESDTDLKSRFANYINTRSRATTMAIHDAVASVRQGISVTVEENVDAAGTWRAGAFLVVVDDGTGSPPSDLLSAAAAAVEAVRPIGSGYAVIPPSVIQANVAMTVTFAPGVDQDAMRAAIAEAVSDYISGLGVGDVLPYSRLPSLAYAAGGQVLNVSAVALDGAQADLGGGVGQVVRPGSITVS